MLPSELTRVLAWPHLCAAWSKDWHVPVIAGDVVVVAGRIDAGGTMVHAQCVAGQPEVIAGMTRLAGLEAIVIAVAAADGTLVPPRRGT